MRPQKDRVNHFDGNKWFENKVRNRTRAALTERGSKASAHSAEYNAEYKKQYALFRAERAEIKRSKHEKKLARRKEKRCAGQLEA